MYRWLINQVKGIRLDREFRNTIETSLETFDSFNQYATQTLAHIPDCKDENILADIMNRQ